ncbi:ThiF family adenylyltransferase [Ruminiclostridium josui]|uniref:ThiF family adenylyltransferase n=1 Tax=Ruminiclostridium josui TaxID=1499 RepID=UPI0006D2A851|nr:ThiF family adenylyltransferase [Ruminiclostridium josui]
MFEHVSRNYPLITREEQEILENSTVAIAGVGGIGGWIADTLVRMGVGHIKVSDLDNYEIHNLNRQAFSNMDVLGEPKVHVVAQELKKINNNLDIKVFDEGVNEKNIENFLDGVDIVIDAVEYFEFKVRRMIQNESRKRGITTFLNVVAGFSVGLFIFSPESMEFDEYIVQRFIKK